MRTALPTVAALFAAALATAIGYGCLDAQPSHDDQLGKPDLIARDASRDLKQTIVVPALASDHHQGKSLLWCSTLSLAWNELADTMGPPIRSDDNPTVAALNAAPHSKADLDKASYVAHAGFGRDSILEQIKDDLQKTFAGAANPSLLPSSVGPDQILAYAYLFKNLEFKDPFIRRKIPLDFAGAQVKSFGLWDDHELRNWSDLAKQIVIHRYASPTEWTVELTTKATDDRLIIARITPGKSLDDTTRQVLASLTTPDPSNKDAPQFRRGDTLIVPLLNFDITRSFEELVGRTLQGTKASGVVDYAKQNIRFRLDEKGAVLKSEVSIGATSAPMPREPKRLIADGPFAIVMMRKSAQHPYFVAWVDNPELLVKWK